MVNTPLNRIMMIEKSRLAIFDIEGSVTVSRTHHLKALEKTLCHYGIPFQDFLSLEKYHTETHYIKTSTGHWKWKSDREELWDEIDEHLCANFETLLEGQPLKAVPGAKQFLTELVENSEFDIVCVSHSLQNISKLKIKSSGIFVPSELIVSAENVEDYRELLGEACSRSKEFYRLEGYEKVVVFGSHIGLGHACSDLGFDYVDMNSRSLTSSGDSEFFQQQLTGVLKDVADACY